MMKTLLLTENVLSDINKYTNDNTDIILYNNGDTYDSILNKINSDTSYNTIGIFSHGNHHSFDFVEKININENNNFINFINSLKTKTNFNTLDIFACYFGINSQFIKTLEEKTDINVRASKNITGSTVFGDWIMETDQIDIKTIYFNENISEFKEILINMASPMNSRRSNYICNLINPNNINELRNHIYSNNKAFAILTNDGKVFRCGDRRYGGGKDANGSYLTDLSGVKAIYSNNFAFAALTNEGKVFRWGDVNYGGSTYANGSYLTEPQDALHMTGVKAIYSNNKAFAAVTNDGKVFRWGDDKSGGGTDANGSYLTDLSGVKTIYSNNYAFAAVTNDGKVFRWGDRRYGGSTVANGSYLTEPQDALHMTGVKAIYSNDFAFVAVTNEGRVFIWGSWKYGGGGSGANGSYLTDLHDKEMSELLMLDALHMTGVKDIYSNNKAFAAVTNDGNGMRSDVNYGGKTDANGSYLTDLTGVKAIYSNNKAFAALTNEGKVFRWGDVNYGGSTVANGSYLTYPQDALHMTGVKAIFPGIDTFSALTNEKKVIRWGGVDGSVVFLREGKIPINNIKSIYFLEDYWIAVKNDGTVYLNGRASSNEFNFVNPNKRLDFNNINIYKSPYFTYENINLLNFIGGNRNNVDVIDFDIHSNKCVLDLQEVKNTLDNYDVDIKDIINYYLYSAGISGNPNVLILGIMSIAPDFPTTKENLLCINHKNVFNLNELAQNECLFTSYIDNTNISDNYNITDGNELSLNITKSDIYYVFNNISTPSNYVPIDCSFNYKY